MSLLRFVPAAVFATALVALPALAAPALTPVPAHMNVGQGSFVLTAHTRIYVPAHDDDAMTAAVWLRDEIAKARGLRLDIVTGEGPNKHDDGISFSRVETFAATPRPITWKPAPMA